MSSHHKENFITKYIFSMDHKMIAKQFLITGMIMAVIGMAMSALFRLQLANPGKSYAILEMFLGKWAPDGVLDPSMYLALVTMHGTILVFWVLTAGLTGTFANFSTGRVYDQIRQSIAYSKKNVKSSTILVRSSAIKNNNSEIKAGKEKKRRTISINKTHDIESVEKKKIINYESQS